MTLTTRRAVLSGTLVGLVSAPFASLGPAFAAPRSPYSRARFTPLLGRRFRLIDGRRSWVVTLTDVSDLMPALAGSNRSFGLTFTSRTAGPPQGTYVFRRPGFAPTTLFVVPSDAARRTYQATVNRAPHG